jgi:hypothetical protein
MWLYEVLLHIEISIIADSNILAQLKNNNIQANSSLQTTYHLLFEMYHTKILAKQWLGERNAVEKLLNVNQSGIIMHVNML